MARYSVQPRERIFSKGYGFLSFAQNMGKNNSKNRSKNLSGKYSLNILNLAKQPAVDVFKTALKRPIKKTAEVTGDLIGNEIANKITRVSQHSQQNNSETVTYGNDEEIPKERYLSPEERQIVIDDRRLI